MKGQRVVVIGMGASGVAAARLCLARGARVTGVDRKELDALGAAAAAFVREGGALAPDADRDVLVASADLVVVSPGVPNFVALDQAAARGTPVWSEVELAWRELAKGAPAPAVPVVAVGGTNGKSTTTTLVATLFEAAGFRTFAGGNLGEPLASHIDEVAGSVERVVLEVSSFQMERVSAFQPTVSILLNVTDDHLDRYPSFDAYAAAKGQAFVRQTESDLAIAPHGDAICLREVRRGKARVVTFGADPAADVQVTDDAVVDHRSGERFLRSELSLQGAHNALNVAAAWAAVRDYGVTADVARRVFASFEGLAHRMALVAELRGVRFYDDSKGTNVGASVTALLGLREPRAVLIAGGVDKGGSYGPLADALAERGRAAVLIGEAAPLIEAALAGRVPITHAASMEAAVKASFALARAGDAVLLSPACSSFDMFRDYKHRGDVFVSAVRQLTEEIRP